jgi:hypothetical protein
MILVDNVKKVPASTPIISPPSIDSSFAYKLVYLFKFTPKSFIITER